MRVLPVPLMSLLVVVLAPGMARAAQPRIFFSDLDGGPNSGGQNNAGAFVTIYGTHFGASRGASFVTIGSGRAVSYPIWSDRKITFQLGRAATTGDIVVTTPAGASNGTPFTVRSGNIYFVGNTGSDDNSGSYSSPWRTLTKARDTIGPGDTVYAMDGVSQTVDDGQGWSAAIVLRTGGIAGAPKALVAYPGATVTVGSVTGPAFGIRSTDFSAGGGACPGYWTFAGLVLRGVGSALALAGPSSDWRIVGNDISCPNGDGAGACFDTSQASAVKFLGNRVHHTGKTNASALYHGVYFSTDSNHVDVGWNSIEYVHGCRGLQVHSSVLIAGTGRNQYDISVHDNLIHDTQCDGMVLATVDPSRGKVEVFNNIIYNAGQGPDNPEHTGHWACILFSGDTNAGAAGGGTAEVYNNTLFNCGSFAYPPYGDGRSAITNSGQNQALRIRIRNNILYQRPGVPYLTIWGPSGLCGDSDNCRGVYGSNNLFFGSGPAPSNPNITQSLNSDPSFANAAQYDFHLGAASPARRAGVDIGAATDKDGVSRGGASGYDLGAVQYVPPAVASLTCSLPAILTPGATTCELRLESAAPAGGVSVTTASDDPSVVLPGFVVVQPGSSTASVPVSTPAVELRGTARISAQVGNSSRTAELWLLPPGDPSPALLAVVNAASFLPGPVAPGGIVSSFGVNLGPEPAAATLSGGPLQTSLAGVTSLFEGTPGPLLYVDANQVNAVVPYRIGEGDVQVEIAVGERHSNPVPVTAAETAPAVFTAGFSGKGQAAAINEDGSVNSSSHPAVKGSVISFYATGLGQTEPPGVDGLPAADSTQLPTAPVSVWIDGLPAELVYAGSAPGFIAGLCRINARIPKEASSGVGVALVLRAGAAESQSDVTVSVQ